MRSQHHSATRGLFRALGLLLALALFVFCRTAEAQLIKRPGAHPRYSIEVEPHLVVQHENRWFGEDEGFGPGVRLTIPLLHNGPIATINNNIGIGFGVDWTMFGDCEFANDDDCDVNQLWFPVVMQWNFFFTPVISVFGEVGPSLVYRSVSFDAGCPTIDGDCDDTDLDLFEPAFFGGGRFLFGDTAGLVVRLGWPSVSIGATFLL